MCRIFTLELPDLFSRSVFTNKQLELIEGLLIEYLTSYIEERGGIDKLDLLSEEELDEMDKAMTEDIMDGLREHFGVKTGLFPRVHGLERRGGTTINIIEKVKKGLMDILFEYEDLDENIFDFKIRILRELIFVLDDIIDNKLVDLLIDWTITLKEDKEEYWKDG